MKYRILMGGLSTRPYGDFDSDDFKLIGPISSFKEKYEQFIKENERHKGKKMIDDLAEKLAEQNEMTVKQNALLLHRSLF